jgi:hypothetical protein
MRNTKVYVPIADISKHFAQTVLILQLKKYLDDMFSELDNETRACHPIYQMLQVMAGVERQRLVMYMEKSEQISLSPELADCEWICVLLESLGVVYKLRNDDSTDDFRFGDFLAHFFLLQDAKPGDVVFDANTTLAIGNSRPAMIELLDIIFNEYSEDKRQETFKRQLRDGYARSYMTKKHIPDKIVKAMEDSQFNETFGYVEFDEDCDVAKIEELYREFRALSNYLKLEEHKEVSLRFRRLGNHKATGLYYPYLKCLCVDISGPPSSFAHELFHMLDYEHGELSRGWGFMKVKELYREGFEALAEKQGVSFKGKYNKDYYFQPTEIFARCGEMYLTKVCKIDNSLVKPDTAAVAYPWSAEMEQAVKEYFEAYLFPHLKSPEDAQIQCA